MSSTFTYSISPLFFFWDAFPPCPNHHRRGNYTQIKQPISHRAGQSKSLRSVRAHRRHSPAVDRCIGALLVGTKSDHRWPRCLKIVIKYRVTWAMVEETLKGVVSGKSKSLETVVKCTSARRWRLAATWSQSWGNPCTGHSPRLFSDHLRYFKCRYDGDQWGKVGQNNSDLLTEDGYWSNFWQIRGLLTSGRSPKLESPLYPTCPPKKLR